MKGSILIVSFFILGVVLAYEGILPVGMIGNHFSEYALYALMFLVGISIGCDRKVLSALKHQSAKIALVPLATILGTLGGSALVSIFLPGRSLVDCLAVGSGFGYYSLSSIFITEYRGAELGTIALAANIIREVITLLGAPFLVCWFGRLAPICAGGATTMDTTLPVITRFSGKEFVIISMFHGFVVDFSVPFLVTFFAKL
ncbi:MAG: lysine exporter LysO family protein [Odoribacter sp.]